MTSLLGARPAKGTAWLPSLLMAFVLLAGAPTPSSAHEGHDHGPPAGGGASPSSPRAHLELVGRLSHLLSQGTLRAVVAKGGTDEEIFQSVDAADLLGVEAATRQRGAKL